MTTTTRTFGTTSRTTRRTLGAAFAATAFGGAAAVAMTIPGGPSAAAAADPCAASEVAKTIGSVANSTAGYLDAHPETNQALTTISQQQAGPQSLVALKSYFDAHPQAAKDMQALQTPLAGLSSRCQLPLTLPQVMGLMQAAQAPAGALAGGLPGAASTAQSVGVPATMLPAQSAPSAVVAPGTGPLPGPATSAYR